MRALGDLARARWKRSTGEDDGRSQAAVMVGWALGATLDVPELELIALFSFLSGAVVLNVLKEELPEERKSRFLPFLAGVAGYGDLLAVI